MRRDDADLLNADNWTLSRPLAFDAEQLNTIHPGLAGQHSGWLEGNLVTAPDGSLADLMRVHLNTPNKAALLEIAPDGSDLSFRPETGIIDFPAEPPNSPSAAIRQPVSISHSATRSPCRSVRGNGIFCRSAAPAICGTGKS